MNKMIHGIQEKWKWNRNINLPYIVKLFVLTMMAGVLVVVVVFNAVTDVIVIGYPMLKEVICIFV